MGFIWGPIQLLIASLMFMLTIKKDRPMICRILLGIAVFATLYLVLPIKIWAQNYVLWQFIWAFFLVLTTIYIYFVLQCTWRQAIYTMSCALAVQHIFWDLKMIFRLLSNTKDSPVFLMEFLLMIIVFAVFYRIFASRLFTGMFDSLEWNDLSTTIVILAFVFGLSSQKGFLGTALIPNLAYLLADATCCFLVLWLQASRQVQYRLMHERDTLESIVSQQKMQYEITQNMIDRINQRCHDIKHQIHSAGSQADDQALKESLQALADNIMVYDTAIRTGNKALDTVLMEKGLLCKDKNIQWICMADGSMLDFIKPSDIYSIFGNLIDNAIEAVEKMEDPEKRIINVRIASHESLVTIQVENLYEGSIVFENDLPVTTKDNKDEHGFGMKSIRYIVSSYDGTFTMNAEGGIFQVKILIPVGR